MLTPYRHLNHIRGRQVVEDLSPARVRATASEKNEPVPTQTNRRWIWYFEMAYAQIGPDVRVSLAVDEAIEQMRRHAIRMIGRELYGELREDALDLLGMLHERYFLATDDPILIKLNGMIRKMEGEDV